jgi:FMN reductase
MSKTFEVVVVNAGTSDPSSTQLLTNRISDHVNALGKKRGHIVNVRVISLRELSNEISTAIVSQLLGPKLKAAVELLHNADGIVAATPVYKAGASGLFTSFFNVLDNDLLIAKPVVLAATAGTARHALVIDDQMRALFAYMRTLVVPTSLFASTEDWSDAELNRRIDRAALELTLLMESGFATAVKVESWDQYQHEFGSAGGTELSVNFDSDIMRLAAGGSIQKPPGKTDA